MDQTLKRCAKWNNWKRDRREIPSKAWSLEILLIDGDQVRDKKFGLLVMSVLHTFECQLF